MSHRTPVPLCCGTQGLQLDHALKNHLHALKPPRSKLFCNIFTAAHASYNSNGDGQEQAAECTAGAGQELQGAALVGSWDGNLPLLIVGAMA